MAIRHARAGEVVDLRPLRGRLRGAQTTALVKSASFEAIRLVVSAGRVIAPHEVPGNITLHCLEGRVLLELSNSALELSEGDWVYLDGGERHAVKGIEDACLLLTILFDR